MNKIKNNNGFLYLAGTLLIIFIVYFQSLFRTWQPFDEGFIYNEEFLPIPRTFSEIFQVISSFIPNCHLLSMNSFFSNIVNIRSDPTPWTILIFILYFFKKNAFLYHIFQLSIHLINALLVWLIFRAGGKPALTSIFTLLWALHPINTEAVLLVTNWNANLTYTFFFVFLLYEIKNINNVNKIINYLIIPVIFLFSMSLTEYSFIFPFVLFLLILSLKLTESIPLKDAVLFSCRKIIPYFIGLSIFAILFLFSKKDSNDCFFFERNIWFVPQIFVHDLKIFFFPKVLSTFQSNLVHLSDSFNGAYSIFCRIIYFLFLILPTIILLKKSKYSECVPLVYAVFLALIPFLHILAPTYCLSAERYWYFPSFLFFYFLINITNVYSKKTILFLVVVLLLLTSRTLIRIQDWQNPFYFYKSAVIADKSSLYRGHKFLIFADFLQKVKMEKERDIAINQSIKELTKALNELDFLKENHQNQPKILKLYGLDYKSLSIKAAYALSIIKKYHLKEKDENIILFLNPYIQDNLDLASIDTISFYGNLLLKSGATEKGINVLEYGYKKIPYYLDLNLALSDAYLSLNEEAKAFDILEKSYAFFPNKGFVLYKLMKYYERKKDIKNQEKFLNLLRLRSHLKENM